MVIATSKVPIYTAAMKSSGVLPTNIAPQNVNDGMISHSASDGRVLVIGSTADYIGFINRHYTGQVAFVTDPSERMNCEEDSPDTRSEVLVSLVDPQFVLKQIKNHLNHHNLRATGVACFDCEYLYLTSLIAADLGLSYHVPEAILASRCKFTSKMRWQQAGLGCPVACQVRSADEAVAFMRQQGGRIILKPLTGSGSELTFLCTTVLETEAAFALMSSRMAGMSANRMYDSYNADGIRIDPRLVFIAEEYCEGDEYSCDFLIEGGKVEIIRITRKWLKADPAPGTIMAYQIPEKPELDHAMLREYLYAAAQALGLERGLCMVDFIMSANRMILLELTPRPGGDCLPQLIRTGYGLDILGLALKVAEGPPLKLAMNKIDRPLVGLRLFAPLPGGIISHIDAEGLRCDPHVLQLELTRQPGCRVIHPPDSYSSRILGYALFNPVSEENVEQECYVLLDKLIVGYYEEEAV